VTLLAFAAERRAERRAAAAPGGRRERLIGTSCPPGPQKKRVAAACRGRLMGQTHWRSQEGGRGHAPPKLGSQQNSWLRR